jgi:hypothetical protein
MDGFRLHVVFSLVAESRSPCRLLLLVLHVEDFSFVIGYENLPLFPKKVMMCRDPILKILQELVTYRMVQLDICVNL